MTDAAAPGKELGKTAADTCAGAMSRTALVVCTCLRAKVCDRVHSTASSCASPLTTPLQQRTAGACQKYRAFWRHADIRLDAVAGGCGMKAHNAS